MEEHEEKKLFFIQSFSGARLGLRSLHDPDRHHRRPRMRHVAHLLVMVDRTRAQRQQPIQQHAARWAERK